MATEERGMIDLQEPYDPRPIRFLELWETGGWRMKVYGVAYRSGRPSEERPTELEYAASTAPSACVWDLFVMCFERDAWLDEVLANPGGPNLDGYLHRRFDGDV
jgi:hypothetical protein